MKFLLQRVVALLSGATILGLSIPYAWADTECDAVYQNATRDLIIDNQDRSSLFSVYDKYCDSKGSVNNTSVGIGIDVVVKNLPINFTGNYGNSSEAISNFCKNYKEVRFSNENSQVTKNTVVVAALENYNECKKIISQGVSITHTAVGPGDIIFSFQLKNAVTAFEIQGVSLGPNITCGSTTLSSDKKWHSVDEKTRASVKSNASISCKRSSTGSEEKVYPLSWVGISTNIGSYTINMLADSIVGGTLASELNNKIDTLKQKNDSNESLIVSQQTQITSLQQAIDKIRNGTKFSTFKFWTGEYGGTTVEGGDRYDPRDNPDPQAIGRRYCPAPAAMNIQLIRNISGGCCGYAWYTGTCISYQ
ncbi:hypothetical protein RNI52_34695 [Labrys neptuniae]|uniref:hypothetical protein n=1 Tax=Labrys neptuniae TaxID=376174 RepID=UPI00288E1FA8|nr:hypothetical protein [Labrys neptuniae]MDT3382527.1 hypothetical protein [Labrys neptuniae]